MKIAVIYKIAISMGVLIMSASVLAQTPDDRAAIERAALNYLEGFYEGSTEKIRQSVHPDAHKFGFYMKDGAYNRVPMSFDGMLEYAENVKEKGNYQTAVAKVYAWWGSDYMTLARYDGKWMIVQVLWQTKPES